MYESVSRQITHYVDLYLEITPQASCMFNLDMEATWKPVTLYIPTQFESHSNLVAILKLEQVVGALIYTCSSICDSSS